MVNYKIQIQFPLRRVVSAIAGLLTLASCFPLFPPGAAAACLWDELHQSTDASLSLPQTDPYLPLLQQSWIAYRQRFIQSDGRVIDREANDRSTSEGQAYAMLRAVLINDPATFARTLEWAENNLSRKDASGKPIDSLWAWKWGHTAQGNWEIQDSNFASDADIDAATALILAARRWNCPEYLNKARVKLNDLWNQSIAILPDGSPYLMPGPKAAFWNQPDMLILNPSYFAPYAFRLFAEIDSDHNWLALVNTSYRTLEESSGVSKVGLPSDWIVLKPSTRQFQPLPASHPLKSLYGFDAYRVWWRLAIDATWFQEPRAKQYLQRNTRYLQQIWRTQQKIPAQITLQGQPAVSYEATAQYAMLYTAFRLTAPKLAEQLYHQKLNPRYQHGFWDNDSAYYTQNLAWFALLPPASFKPLWPNTP